MLTRSDADSEFVPGPSGRALADSAPGMFVNMNALFVGAAVVGHSVLAALGPERRLGVSELRVVVVGGASLSIGPGGTAKLCHRVLHKATGFVRYDFGRLERHIRLCLCSVA